MSIDIVRSPRGYYSLYVDGIFVGNYDTQDEAIAAADALRHPDTAEA